MRTPFYQLSCSFSQIHMFLLLSLLKRSLYRVADKLTIHAVRIETSRRHLLLYGLKN